MMDVTEEIGQPAEALSELRTPLKLQQTERIWGSVAAKRYYDRFLPTGTTQSTQLNLTNSYCMVGITWKIMKNELKVPSFQ